MTGPTVGSQVSHYRLERVLGAGGMGQVFLARDLTLDRPVAIKFLIATQDEHARKRLLAEARAAASLDHPAICTVHEVVTDDAIGDFIVMNYVEGETLGNRLRRGRLAPSETMALMVPLLQALGTAHRAGVVHRDIKPHNIVLTPAGLPKLLDFGIARRIMPESGNEDGTTASMLTGEGNIVGTLGYMSPEQVQGRPVDARSDLFSLGSVLFECLTGNRAFAGASRAETIGALLHVDPPPPSQVVAELAPTFDALCADLLRKVPSERFQTAEEVLGAIRGLSPTQRMAAARDEAPVVFRRPSRRHLTMAGAGVVVAAVLGVAWVWMNGRTSLPEPDPQAVPWFTSGVEKLREGSYTGARTALEEAVRLSPNFIQAHLRLAEARSELDDAAGAQQSLLQVNALLPVNARLRQEDQLRLDAVRWSVLRDHQQAIAAYQQLADLSPNEASSWLDVGRAEDAAGRRVAAMGHFEQAVKLDAQYAPARQRLGVLQSQGGQSEKALATLGEAIRLHKLKTNVEGEAEATLRKATVHLARRELADAGTALARVAKLAEDEKFVSLRIRAQFAQARLAQADGQIAEAEKLSRTAVDKAIALGMGTIAADGLRGLATAMMVAGRYDDADVQLKRAIDLAMEQKATRTEMQARVQQAALRLQDNKFTDAVAMADAPLRFFTAGRYVRNEAETKSIQARAHEALEHYDDARRLASEVLALAESIDDQVLIGVSLENLAGQAERLGQLPEALALRERLEKIHRTSNDHVSLAFDLVNRADLLIRLGRGAESEAPLAEVDSGIAAGRQAYSGRSRRVSLMRAFRASIEERFGNVETHTRLAIDPATGPPSDTTLFAWLLAEHARARLGTSREAVDVIAGWPGQASKPAMRREMTYWAARTLMLRRNPDLARKISEEAWNEAPARTNLELRWRLAALAAQASGGATMRAAARGDLMTLLGQWPVPGVTYVARPDLAALRKDLE
ncbi:MAG: protein kinase [Vicinamibacterales bacterium]